MEDYENEDASDSEDEFTENDKILLKKNRSLHHGSDNEEEVFGLVSSSDESENVEIADDIESDIEENKSDDLPDSRAWGHKRKNFYDTDLDPDHAGIQGRDAEAAELEELEARNIQERLAEQLDAGTEFSLDVLSTQMQLVASEEKLEGMLEPLLEEKIQADLSKLTKRQKLDLIKKESPEFFGLVNDFKEKMTEIINVWQPMKKLLVEKKLKSPLVELLVQTKHTLILNYCTQIGLYLLLKCLKLPVQSHPIIKRLFQMRQLMGSLTELGELVIDQFDPIMKMVNKDQEIKDEMDEDIVAEPKRTKRKKRILNFLLQEPEIKKYKAESYEKMIPENNEENRGKSLKSILKTSKEPALPGRGKMYKKKQDDKGSGSNLSDGGEEKVENVAEEGEPEDQELEEEGKRAITYQMAKNKGLTPRRKKEQRNPRVKHRNKFRKAKIRRKGQVREVRVETSRYGGEISGIKASVCKSIKIK